MTALRWFWHDFIRSQACAFCMGILYMAGFGALHGHLFVQIPFALIVLFGANALFLKHQREDR